MQAVASAWGERVVCAGEAPLPDRLGRPDYAIHRNGWLAGYVELKAPGTGANAARFKGRDRAQFKRFSAIPNLLYTDGNEWALYRGGERAGRIVRLAGDVAGDGRKAVRAEDARTVEPLLRDFLSWEPVLPLDRGGADRPRGLRGAAGAAVPDAARRRVRCAGGLPVSPGAACRRLAAASVPGRDGRAVRRRLRPDRGLRPVAGAERGSRPAHPRQCGGRAGRTAQPAVPRPAGADRPRGAHGDGRFARSAAAGGVRGAVRPAGRAARSVAVLLRRLPRRLRPEAAQGRRGLLHAGGGGARAGASGRRRACPPAAKATRLRRPRCRHPRSGGGHRDLPPRGHRARPGARGGGAGGGGRGGAGRDARGEPLRLRADGRSLRGERVAGEPRPAGPGGRRREPPRACT